MILPVGFVDSAQHSIYLPNVIVAMMDNSLLYQLTFTELIVLFLYLQNSQQVSLPEAEEGFSWGYCIFIMGMTGTVTELYFACH